MVDVINLCRNISDGVRPFMPPCSLVHCTLLQRYHILVYHRLCLVYPQLLGTHFSLSCYMLLFSLVTADRNLVFVYPLSDCVPRKCLNILDVNCFPLSCITLSGLPLITIQSSNTFRISTDLFLLDHLLATFLEQSSRQLSM